MAKVDDWGLSELDNACQEMEMLLLDLEDGDVEAAHTRASAILATLNELSKDD